jgi:hypothetical protein
MENEMRKHIDTFKKKMLENQNYNFGRYILILDSIEYDIKTSLLVIQDEDELNKFMKSFEKEVTGGSSKIKLILDTTNMKYYDGDSWKQTSLITWSQYIGDYGF